MTTFASATVTALLSERPGLQRVDTDLGRAYVLTSLVGSVAVGDRVVLNTTAVDLGLGTGGWHVVHWNLARESWHAPGGGHVLKLRYTSVQTDVGVAEETGRRATVADEPGGGAGAGPSALPSLGGRPVVVCALHSQVGVVVSALATAAPLARVVYVMTDEAALPLALSDLVAALSDRRLVVATITAGQAFGGDVEAVSVPSALALAVDRLGADAVVVGPGPGVVGTGTALGTSTIEVASVLDVVGALGGEALCAVRASDADERARHRGVSHHTRTALALAARPAVLALPVGDVGDRAETTLREAGAVPPHRVERVAVGDVAALLDALGLPITTMGRGVVDDPAFFEVSAAAGVAAGLRAQRATSTVAP